MNTNNSKLDWGNVIIITETAPQHFKPGLSGSICGIRFINNDELAFQFGQDVGSELYLVEFGNGETLEIPKAFLTFPEYWEKRA